MYSPGFKGACLIMVGLGLSVARARAAKVSIIMFTQRSITVFKGDEPSQIVPANTNKRQEMLVVI